MQCTIMIQTIYSITLVIKMEKKNEAKHSSNALNMANNCIVCKFSCFQSKKKTNENTKLVGQFG